MAFLYHGGISIKLGFSSLSLFMKSLEEILEIAVFDGFDLVEILCEGPYWPKNLLKIPYNQNYTTIYDSKLKNMDIEIFYSYDVEIMLHAPTIDLNPASMNPGIRNETEKQTKEALDLGAKIGATAVTTHPGIVHRKEDRIRNLALDFAIDTLTSCQKYAEEIGVTFSVENMPSKSNFLANSPHELRLILKSVESSATIDWGHANTFESPHEYLNLPNISYFHLNDNMGKKDSHLPLGEGTADFSLMFLNKVKKGIIELNSYENVLKSKKFLLNKERHEINNV